MDFKYQTTYPTPHPLSASPSFAQNVTRWPSSCLGAFSERLLLFNLENKQTRETDVGHAGLYIGLHPSQISHFLWLSFCNVEGSLVCNQGNQAKCCSEWKLGGKWCTHLVSLPRSPVAVLVDYDGDRKTNTTKPTDEPEGPVPMVDFFFCCCRCYCPQLPDPINVRLSGLRVQHVWVTSKNELAKEWTCHV